MTGWLNCERKTSGNKSKSPFLAMQYPKSDLTICLEKVRWVREIWEETLTNLRIRHCQAMEKSAFRLQSCLFRVSVTGNDECSLFRIFRCF